MTIETYTPGETYDVGVVALRGGMSNLFAEKIKRAFLQQAWCEEQPRLRGFPKELHARAMSGHPDVINIEWVDPDKVPPGISCLAISTKFGIGVRMLVKLPQFRVPEDGDFDGFLQDDLIDQSLRDLLHDIADKMHTCADVPDYQRDLATWYSDWCSKNLTPVNGEVDGSAALTNLHETDDYSSAEEEFRKMLEEEGSW